MGKHHNIELGILIVLLAVILFWAGRVSNQPRGIIQQPDVDKYIRAIDSVKLINLKLDSLNVVLSIQVDSLSKLKAINHIKTKNAIKEIKNFTVNSRQRFADSVARANGFR